MAYVLSSVSGNLISAASAGFAPTNSADVSAIASSYQVVSATATQIYAGTAYVTSVNDAPISASRAGNAANASLANSAWYDGTGRLISSLPDSAAVSAIASAYAESAASSKQDTLTFGYDGTSISSIDGSSLAGGGGGIDSATCSAIASAYAESAVSSKADGSALSSYVPYSSLEYNTASAISGINGSALAAGSTYSAGEGIDITDDVISVETPVDIVAGPGIVIDNPDGNTLRVSVAQADETVLWETTSADVGTVAPIALSESIYNFEKIKIVGRLNGNNHIGAPMSWEWYTTDIPVGSYLNCFGLPLNDYDNFSLGIYLRNSVECVSANNSLTHTKTYSWQLQGTTLTNQTTEVWGQLRYFRVVGIHRIQGGN